MLVERNWRVTLSHEVLRDVVHEHGTRIFIASRAHVRVVDDFGHEIEQTRRPHRDRVTAEIPGLTHDPVLPQIDVLEHIALPIDLDALEQRARLAVVGKRLSP